MTKAQQAALDKLNPQQQKAAIAHASGKTITAAMREAGYSQRYINADGPKFLQGNPRFIQAVESISLPVLARAVSSAERCIEELAAISYSDIGDLMNFDGERLTMKAFKEMPPAARRAIASIKAKVIPAKDGEATQVMEMEFKLHNKTATLPILANHHKVTNAEVPAASQIHLHFFQPDEARAIIERMRGKGAKRILDVPTEKE